MSPIPEGLIAALAALAVATVMFGLGLVMVPRDLAWMATRPGAMLRGLFATVVAVPIVAVAVTRALELPWLSEVGILLMAIAPGAPIALRRSLDAGGHRSFAPSLQVGAAILAAITMPLSIAALNPLYAGQWSIAPWAVARQVILAQLVPLALGMVLARSSPGFAAWLEPWLRSTGMVLVVFLIGIVLVDVWEPAMRAGFRVAFAVILITLLALAIGHGLGGTEPTVRTAVAIICAARNAGLALLVAASNGAPPVVSVTVLAYVVVAVLVISPYVAWRRRVIGN